VPTSLGFFRKSLAFGVGYSLSVALGGAFLAATAPHRLSRSAALQALGATTHGLRLAHYIFTRDKGGVMPADYKARVAAMDEGDTSLLGRLKRLPLVASCAGMYSLVMAPLVHSLRHPASDDEPLPWLGVALQWGGLALAAIADWQKNAQKRAKPDRWCEAGLYRYCRHPNYAGELMFWSGAFVAGAKSYRDAGEWLSASMGLAAMVTTMLGATSRLERKEAARYAGVPGRAAYVQRTGALMPRVKALRLPRLRKPPQA
jgi:steroid 5-alpha reductase family enzyme